MARPRRPSRALRPELVLGLVDEMDLELGPPWTRDDGLSHDERLARLAALWAVHGERLIERSDADSAPWALGAFGPP